MAFGPISPRSLAAASPFLLAGLGAAWLAAHVYRQRGGESTDVYTDLWRSLLAVCLTFALGFTGSGLSRLLFDELRVAFTTTAFLSVLPWAVFALYFVGRGSLVTRRRVAAAVSLLVLFVLTSFPAVFFSDSSGEPSTALLLVAAVLVLAAPATVFAVSSLAVLSAYRHRSLSTLNGVVVSLPALLTILAVQVTRASTPLLNNVVLAAIAALVTCTLAVLVTRFDVLRSRAGIGTLGDRTVVRELNEAVVTVERNGSLARVNETASELFGSKLDSKPFVDIVGYEVSALADRNTVECWTERGRRQFDPRVQELTNEHGEVLGHTVTLIDVTDREIRRQRIEVLNRIFRHNIRNSLDVITANAEAVSDEARSAPILETASTIEALGADARRIEDLMRRSQGEARSVELATVVASVVETFRERYPDASIAVSLPDRSVETDGELLRFALRNLVENAIEHNDTDSPRVDVRGSETATGLLLVVADDGPGIPESERAVIERETESPESHASSLGLWGTNWAVTQLGGDLSFADSDLGGTAVTIELPVR